MLARRDKWFLGSGSGAVYAPPFPLFLRAPGFWDECFFADVPVRHLFTGIFLERSGRPVPLEGQVLEWRPDRMVLEHRGGDRVLLEERLVAPRNAWVVRWTLRSGPPLEAVVWSLLPVRPPGAGVPWQSVTDAAADPEGLSFRWETAWPLAVAADRSAVEGAEDRGGPEMGSALALFGYVGADAPRRSWSVNLAQAHAELPDYRLTMLPEKWREGRLPEEVRFRVGVGGGGLLHLYQAYQLSPERPLTVAVAMALAPDDAKAAWRASLEDPLGQSEQAWREAFASVPRFRSSNSYLDHAYWNRWFGLRLNTVAIPNLPLRTEEGEAVFEPFVTEGVGFFRSLITYSSQAILREVGWMHDPSLARGILTSLARSQRRDGSFPGHGYSCRPPRDFYHADWATPTRQLEAIHPGAVPAEWWRALERYARWLATERLGPLGACTIVDQNETGQEYMSRYQTVREDADAWGRFELGGVEATGYALALADLLGDEGERARWRAALQALHRPGEKRYADAFAKEGEIVFSEAVPATCFFPLLYGESIGLEASERAAMVRRWLANPNEFWLPRGFPAIAASDPAYTAEPEWKGQRMNCPWNGRSWPMANSHLVDAIAATARTADPESRPLAAEALRKAIELLALDGEPGRPSSYEHYNPETGAAPLYRGYDDYMHSWLVDLILRHAVGVRLEGGELPGGWGLDPLDPELEFECEGIPHPEGRLAVIGRAGRIEWELKKGS